MVLIALIRIRIRRLSAIRALPVQMPRRGVAAGAGRWRSKAPSLSWARAVRCTEGALQRFQKVFCMQTIITLQKETVNFEAVEAVRLLRFAGHQPRDLDDKQGSLL